MFFPFVPSSHSMQETHYRELELFSMEKVSYNSNITSLLIDLFSSHVLFSLIHRFSSSFISYWPLMRCDQFRLIDKPESKSEQMNKNNDQGKKQIITSRSNEDCYDLLGQHINMVIEKLGIEHSLEGEELENQWGFDEICEVFEEEPSVHEIREAFDIFDENKDGFIDAGELQRVLCALGLKQGSELEACREMIGVFDKNGDGKIDFNEFVRFMLKSF